MERHVAANYYPTHGVVKQHVCFITIQIEFIAIGWFDARLFTPLPIF
jgi:hypothetical protein